MKLEHTKEEWIKAIDGTKTAVEVAKELDCCRGNVYNAAKRYGLQLKKDCWSSNEYFGISLEQFKEELKNYSLWQVSQMHHLSYCSLRQWLEIRGVTNVVQNKQRKLEPIKNLKPCKRTGEAHDMIKFLATRYTLAAIGRVFGYSKERIRQIVNEEKNNG